MNSWNGLDFFIFLILSLNTVLGIARGAAKEIISLMCLSVALIFSIRFTIPLSNFMNSSPLINNFIGSKMVQNFMLSIGADPLTTGFLAEISYSISLLICFVGIFSICESALAMTGFIETFSFPYAALNRQLGGTLGFTRGYIISLILLSILSFHIYKNRESSVISNSFFANLFSSQAKLFDEFIIRQNPENFQELYRNKPYNEKQLYQNIGNPNYIDRQISTPTTPKTSKY